MSYVHITDGVIDSGPGPLWGSWQDPEGNTHALPMMTPLELKALGWLSYVHSMPPLAPHEKYGDPTAQVVGTDYIVTEVVVPMNAEEITAAEAAQWENVRADRHNRMLACDWIGNRAAEVGVPIEPDWQAYRQALRDITTQSDPWNIVWPDPPPAPTVLIDDKWRNK